MRDRDRDRDKDGDRHRQRHRHGQSTGTDTDTDKNSDIHKFLLRWVKTTLSNGSGYSKNLRDQLRCGIGFRVRFMESKVLDWL